jgi:hypothetical protein
MEINREEVKEEVFKLGKWTRFVFMVLYAFVLNFVITVSIGLAFIQFLFFLFTSKVNESLSDFNKHLFLFVSDTLEFLLFDKDDKPFPFKKSKESQEDSHEVVDGDVNDAQDVSEDIIESAEVEEISEEVVQTEEDSKS